MPSLSLCLSRWDNFPSDLKIYKEVKNLHTYDFSFSSKNPRRTLEPLSRGWHKNWQPTCCQEGARLCWKVKNTQSSKVSSNFSLLTSFQHKHSYKQSVNIHYSIAFTVPFYCFFLSKHLGLLAVHHF